MKTLNKNSRFPQWKLALKNATALLSIVSLLCLSTQTAQAQKIKKLGKVADFRQTLSLQYPSENLSRKGTGNSFKLSTSGASLTAKINVHTTEGGIERFVGSVENHPNSTVYLTFTDGKVEGKAVLLKEKKVYEYATNAQGEVEVKRTDIHQTVCVDYQQNAKNESKARITNSTPAPAPPANSPVYNLQSLPGVQNVLKLDFDGEYVVSSRWNGGIAIDALPTNYTEAEITEIWKLISEDFRAFNINVTTNEAIYLAAPLYSRTRCIFTPTTTAAPEWGGVAYVGSFFWNEEVPCWVFNYGVKEGGETGSHELGHALGLGHDGRTNPVEEYYGGNNEWAPIMGNSMYSKVTHWSKGEYAYANNTQDDINIIANTTINNTTATIGFRTDEAGNTETTAKLLVYNTAGDIDSLQNVGIITNRTDVDVYYFNSTGGTASINVASTLPSYANLDIQLTLKNNSGTTIATVNPTNSLDASIATVLPAGKYYIIIDGVGKGDPAGTGYSDYSSIGRYKITGNIIANTPPTVSLSTNSPVVDYYGTLYVKALTNFELYAAVNDVEGPIAKVEFYKDNVKIGEDAFYPGHSWTVTNLTAGTYTFKAKAFDQAGLTTWSSPITIIVDGASPTVNISSPLNNATFAAPATFEVIANPNDGQGPVRKVEFYQNNVLVGYDDAYPGFYYYASNLAAGTYVYTAKVFDIAGNTTTSAPITVTVTAPACLVNEATPVASQFLVRNAWHDESSGSLVSNESGALKVVHRAYGNSDLWVLETGKTFSVLNGQVYNIKLDFKDFAAKTVSGIDVGFATAVNGSNTGPTLLGSTVSFPSGFSSAAFTTKSVNLTASASGTVFVAIKLKWSSQPTVQISDYIKNLKVCAGAGTPSRTESASEEELASGLSINPNPSETLFNTLAQRDIEALQVTDLQGRSVYANQGIAKDTYMSFGSEFNTGVYIVNVQYTDGTHESFKVVKTK